MEEVTDIQRREEYEKPMSIGQMKAQVDHIQQLMKQVMQKDQHFGVIPGCGDKPSLLKPGAEKIMFTFRLVPETLVETNELSNPSVEGHREYRATVKLYSRGGNFLGSGVGSCSTMESKFRFRKADLECPECGQKTIIKGKIEYGGGWVCFKKKGGCGAKFPDEFFDATADKTEHENPADYYNTCEKMAKKRALVDAVLTTTAASDIFTQDIEDMAENGSFEPPKNEAPKQDFVPPPQKKSEDSIITSLKFSGTKTGTKKNGEQWTMFIYVDPQGNEYGFFDNKGYQEIQTYLNDAQEDDTKVKIWFRQDRKIRLITKVEPVFDA